LIVSAKNVDKKNRLRSKYVGFRVSPEEDIQLEKVVALSGQGNCCCEKLTNIQSVTV